MFIGAMRMSGDLNDSVRALAKQYPLHDIVLAIAHVIDDGARAGVLDGARDAAVQDLRVLQSALGQLSRESLRPTGERLAIS